MKRIVSILVACWLCMSAYAGDFVLYNGTNMYTVGGGVTSSLVIPFSTQYLYYASSTNCTGLWADADNVYLFKIKMGVYTALTNAIP